MQRTRIGALARRIIIQFLRDRRTLGLIFIVPIFVISLLAFIMRGETEATKIGVVNLDVPVYTRTGQVAQAQRVIDELKLNEAFDIEELSFGEANALVKKGEIKAMVVFPEDFSQQLTRRRDTALNIIWEGSKSDTSATVRESLDRALGAILLKLTASPVAAVPAVERETAYVEEGGEDFDTLDNFAPIFISLFAFFFVFLLTSVSFLRERSQGTMERLLASPLSRAEIIVGYMLGFSIFAFIQSLVIFLYTIYALQVRYLGNPGVIFLIIAILTLGAVNLGIFLSTYARNELQVVQFIPLVITPQALLCGVFWPIENMPEVLQWIAYALPLTYANDALQKIMLDGFTITEGTVPRDILALALFAGVMVLAGAFTMRREVA